MRKLVCAGCGFTEDLNNQTGAIHTMQLIDLSPLYDTLTRPDAPIEEDLCGKCRDRIRFDFFGIHEPELLGLPFMKGA